MMIMAFHMAQQQQIEEDRLIRQVLEESKYTAAQQDPTNPDVDNMTYEQLLEMADNAGKVSMGLPKHKID